MNNIQQREEIAYLEMVEKQDLREVELLENLISGLLKNPGLKTQVRAALGLEI